MVNKQIVDFNGDVQKLEEEFFGDRDHIFNFEPQHTQGYRDAKFCRPFLDEALLAKSPEKVDAIRWPEDRPFAALLSHDVDGVQERSRQELWRLIRVQITTATSFKDQMKALSRLTGMRHRHSNRDLLSPWLQIEAERGFKSTFFLFPTNISKRDHRDVAYYLQDEMLFEGKLQSVASVFRQVADRGWEIGLHGSIESAFSPGMLEMQKQDIEKALGVSLVSSRQHNLQFGAAVTPDLIASAGLQIDCTLGSNRTVFFRTGTSYPHRLWSVSKNDWLDVWEIPLILHDGALLRSDNLDLSPDSAFRFCRKVIERVAKVRGVVSLLWHPENIVKPGYFELYERLLDLLHEMGAWGTSAKEIIEWWNDAAKLRS